MRTGHPRLPKQRIHCMWQITGPSKQHIDKHRELHSRGIRPTPELREAINV
jgi:hypothetical protein